MLEKPNQNSSSRRHNTQHIGTCNKSATIVRGAVDENAIPFEHFDLDALLTISIVKIEDDNDRDPEAQDE